MIKSVKKKDVLENDVIWYPISIKPPLCYIWYITSNEKDEWVDRAEYERGKWINGEGCQIYPTHWCIIKPYKKSYTW